MTKMQAMIVPEAGARLSREERDIPVPGRRIATVTDAEAMQAIVGGLGAGDTMMLIGAVGPIQIDPIELLTKSPAVKGWYSGTSADPEDTLLVGELTDIASMDEIYPFAEAQAAYDHMMRGKARFRVVLKMA